MKRLKALSPHEQQGLGFRAGGGKVGCGALMLLDIRGDDLPELLLPLPRTSSLVGSSGLWSTTLNPKP